MGPSLRVDLSVSKGLNGDPFGRPSRLDRLDSFEFHDIEPCLMKSLTLAGASALLLISPLGAGDAMATAPEPVISPSPQSDWELTLGLYAWGAGLDGTLGAAGVTAPVDISFSDILDTLDMTAMGAVELRKDRWGFQLEGLYLRNSLKGTAFLPVTNRPVAAKLTAKTTRLQPVLTYRLVENEHTTVDLLAGATYYNISNEIRVFGPRAVRGGKAADDWFDPVVGVRVNQRIAERWSLQGRADIGGFGVNSDLVWQALGLVGYDLTPSATLFGGWRHAAVDYSNGGFVYDAASSGPIIGVALTW